jgi:hypothetical protein
MLRGWAPMRNGGWAPRPGLGRGGGVARVEGLLTLLDRLTVAVGGDWSVTVERLFTSLERSRPPWSADARRPSRVGESSARRLPGCRRRIPWPRAASVLPFRHESVASTPRVDWLCGRLGRLRRLSNGKLRKRVRRRRKVVASPAGKTRVHEYELGTDGSPLRRHGQAVMKWRRAEEA